MSSMVTLRNNGSAKARDDAMERFLEAYRELGSIPKACAEAGVSRKSIWQWRNEFPAFQTRVEQCIDYHVDSVEASVFERAHTSDTLAIFWLKSHMPAKYRDSLRIEQVSHTASELAQRYGLTEAELMERARSALAEQAKLPATSRKRIVEARPQRPGRYQDS